MREVRPAIALHPRHFGRGRTFAFEAPAERSPISADVRLFATTFAAGFLFVTLFLA